MTDVIEWLLDGDPAIRWQTLRDLTDAMADEIDAERARVATEGIGAEILAAQAEDGRWSGKAWNRGYDSTMHALTLLHDIGLDPNSDQAKQAIARIVDGHVTWKGCGPPECNDNMYFEGEIEPCINGQVALPGAYFGADVRGLIDRLLSEQLADGGWNCEAERGSTRSSFNTTICVLEALLAYERSARADTAIADARTKGEEYLLERRLFHRLSTGEPLTQFTQLAYPAWWHYDVLRGLDYLRSAGVAPDERTTKAIDVIASKADENGRWTPDVTYEGRMLVDIDPERFMTLRAMRVLNWFG